MDLVGFTNFMSSTTKNSILQPRHSLVYQDMTQPLSHYYIASSHNTYLEQDQLKGPSSVNAYKRALLLGCRCVELDCWDGEKEPIVYHGFTLTSKITFRSIIETVKTYAFRTSPYPVILSLENHCSNEFQVMMAKILVEVLGSSLAKPIMDQNPAFLPSPEQLKYKILIKGKTLSKKDLEKLEQAKAKIEAESQEDSSSSSSSDGEDVDEDAKKKIREIKDKKKLEKKKGKLKIAPALSELVFLKGGHVKKFADSIANAKCYEMSSFAEAKTAALIVSDPVGFVEYNKKQLSRIYPAGFRFDSSNYDPTPAWAHGCQIVALNYQTASSPMFVNQGRFVDNGGSGYLLKPESLRTKVPKPSAKLIKLNLISGRQLPKPGGSHKGEVIDPFVKIQVFGSGEEELVTFQTKTVNDNGFNPIWEQTFRFEIQDPDFATLLFRVYDEDIGNRQEFIGYAAIPVNLMRPGHRTIPLFDDKHKQIVSASLFVHVDIEDEDAAAASAWLGNPAQELEFLTAQWQRTPRDRDNKLGFEAIYKMLVSLNFGESKAVVKQVFEAVDRDKTRALEFNEFVDLLNRLRELPAIAKVYEKYAGGQNMSAEALAKFLEKEQGMAAAAAASVATEIIKKFGRDSSISLGSFSNLLHSTVNSVAVPRHLVQYQDMTQPLAHYYIASSHNTYLEQDQLKGPSSVNAYKRALLLGCRCVELDCWDGSKEPIVYHGFTLTSKITFRSIIETIKRYAFKTSPYPVILSLENHCSHDQQVMMANILKSVLGDALLLPLPEDTAALPSPESLKGRVLIKGTPAKKRAEDPDDGDDDDDDDTGDALDKQGKVPDDQKKKLKELKEKKGKVEKPKVAQEFSDLISLRGAKFKSFEESWANQKCYQMSSFAEGKTFKLIESERDGFVKFNARQLSRIYPAGGRVDSSNYEPIIPWSAGCQIVALNYQTPSLPMFMNQGKFQENGRTGYLLKAPSLLGGSNQRAELKITVHLISGRQLPKPGQSSKGEVIDPYVEISTHGVPGDDKLVKSKTISNNGFKPVWDEKFEFSVKQPQHAVLVFRLWDADVAASDFIGYYAVSVDNLRPGFRSVPVWGSDHRPVPHASLLVHLTLTDGANLPVVAADDTVLQP
eukprot:TRINITY_DN24_c0_g1_i6.p1 TRINITY_DN24_c0_g1~~TRINITY_DN24_c0_g1_i6.p1  ORF type:complete len:1277 (-),score=394.93 TRINITY_DN24_c0_g1_i6:93-3458(-)